MKKLFCILFAIALFAGCDNSNNKPEEEPEYPPLGELTPQSYFITDLVWLESIETDTHKTETGNLTYIKFKGESISSDSESEVVTQLLDSYGDGSFNGGAIPYSHMALAYPVDKITLLCDKDFDSEHPKGTPLDDIISMQIIRYWDYIQNGYKYPEGHKYQSYYLTGGVCFVYYLTEINSKETKLLQYPQGNYPQLFFETNPDTPGEYTFTLSLTTNGETFTTTFAHTFE